MKTLLLAAAIVTALAGSAKAETWCLKSEFHAAAPI
jgi:hypothetical protein